MDVENAPSIDQSAYESPSNTIVDLSAWSGSRKFKDTTLKNDQPVPATKATSSSSFYGKPTVKKSIGPL